MKLEIVVSGMLKFVEMELIPTIDNEKKWNGEFALGYLRNQAYIMVDNLLKHRGLKMLGIVDNDGGIDVDVLLKTAKETTKTQGTLELSIPGIGIFKLGEAAFDSIGEYIAEQGK